MRFVALNRASHMYRGEGTQIILLRQNQFGRVIGDCVSLSDYGIALCAIYNLAGTSLLAFSLFFLTAYEQVDTFLQQKNQEHKNKRSWEGY